MGRIAVVTTFSPLGYETYGRRMIETFDRNWPADIPLYIFHENAIPVDAPTPRTVWFNLDWNLHRQKFMATHTDMDRAEFLAKYPPSEHWRYYSQNQPVKFSHKVFALTSTPRDVEWLIWLDADVETKAPVTHEFLTTITPDDCVASFLGRKWWTHTETGFVAYRMSETGRQFLDDLRAVYTTDKIMQLTQKHDCSAFDYVRQVYEGKGHKFLDLGENHRGPKIDVMAKSVLAPYLWHNKGEDRKIKAYGRAA